MSCRHAKGGICTNLACTRAGADLRFDGPCVACDFAEEPGERRPRRAAEKQLAVEAYSGPIPKGAVRCLRCGRPCKAGTPDPKARMLRKKAAGDGYCLDCLTQLKANNLSCPYCRGPIENFIKLFTCRQERVEK